jgi:hypothetical protein
VEVDVKGLDDLLKALQNQAKIQDRLKKATRRAFEVLATQLAIYPPRPGSHYKRTFRLRDGWLDAPPNFEFNPRSTFGFKAKMTNPTPYATDVQGGKDDASQQEGIHAGIWQIDDEIVESAEPSVQDIYQEAADEIANLF